MIARAFWFLVWAALRAWAQFCARDVIMLDGQRYMTRYYLRGEPGGDGPSLRLHHIHTKDPDRGLHDHPWEWARSRILRGGYREIRQRMFPHGAGCFPLAYERRPGDVVTLINFEKARDVHRIACVYASTWTLFKTGPKHSRGWGFTRT